MLNDYFSYDTNTTKLQLQISSQANGERLLGCALNILYSHLVKDRQDQILPIEEFLSNIRLAVNSSRLSILQNNKNKPKNLSSDGSYYCIDKIIFAKQFTPTKDPYTFFKSTLLDGNVVSCDFSGWWAINCSAVVTAITLLIFHSYDWDTDKIEKLSEEELYEKIKPYETAFVTALSEPKTQVFDIFSDSLS